MLVVSYVLRLLIGSTPWMSFLLQGSQVTIADFRVGAEVELLNRTMHICDADKATREYFRRSQNACNQLLILNQHAWSLLPYRCCGKTN